MFVYGIETSDLFTRNMGLLFAALMGLCIGSFYTATASRVLYYFYGPGRKHPRRWREFFTRPSRCMSCDRDILWLDLLPLLGYLRLSGRCRFCGTGIGRSVFAGELFCGLLLPLLLWSGFSWPVAFFTVLLCGQLYVSIATDFHLYLLDYENTAVVGLWALLAAFFRPEGFATHVYAGLGTLVVFVALYYAGGFIRRMRGLGLGDVFLAPPLALYAGFPNCLVVFQSAALGSILYVFFVLKDRRAPAPFGVFLALGLYLTVVVEALFLGG